MRSTPHTLATRGKIGATMRKYTDTHLITTAQAYLDRYSQGKSGYPTLAGLARTIGITQSTLLDRANASPDLLLILEQLSDYQEEYLVSHGVGMTERHDRNSSIEYKSTFNPAFAIFLLKAKHHYTDTPQQLTQNNTFTISADVLAEALKLAK